ncbi:hypothetical protein [Paraburkholderia graminis]|uniref:hypothetical protein n=1 Tax=Paraburkholderia graminis TaxID=60548 RepID=UPI0004A7BA47|nr:hypothetical protein [Paraburkholderia graminis]MDQ0627259.1 hypothetical protein [Paraburkholderia graminis]
MRLKSAAPVALLTIFLMTASHAQVPRLPSQTSYPEHYSALPTSERQLYVAGALDAIRGINPQTREMFNECLPGMTLSAATQLVDQGLATLEPVLRSTVPIALHNALLVECERRGFRPVG